MIVIILGKSGFDCSEYLSKEQQKFIGHKIIRAWTTADLKHLRLGMEIQVHQTPAFFTDPNFDMIDMVESLYPPKDERTRNIYFDKMCMRVHDVDLRIITDHTNVVPVLPSKNEFRFFGSFRINDMTTHFIGSGVEIKTDGLGVPFIKILAPYKLVNPDKQIKVLNEDQQ